MRLRPTGRVFVEHEYEENGLGCGLWFYCTRSFLLFCLRIERNNCFNYIAFPHWCCIHPLSFNEIKGALKGPLLFRLKKASPTFFYPSHHSILIKAEAVRSAPPRVLYWCVATVLFLI